MNKTDQILAEEALADTGHAPEKPQKPFMGEAPAVMFTNYKREDGFEMSLTLRGNSGSEVMQAFEKAINVIKQAKGTPLPMRSSSGAFNKPAVPTKPCPFHPGQPLKQKIMPDGKELWSHSRGVYPNLVYCNGQGFPDERTARASYNPPAADGDYPERNIQDF